MSYEEEKLSHQLDKAYDDLHGLNEDYGKLMDKLCAADARADEAEYQLEQARKMLVLAGRVAEDWLSGQSGNYEWQHRLYYALELEPLEHMEKWDDDYVYEHQRHFGRWLEEEKEKLGIKFD